MRFIESLLWWRNIQRRLPHRHRANYLSGFIQTLVLLLYWTERVFLHLVQRHNHIYFQLAGNSLAADRPFKSCHHIGQNDQAEPEVVYLVLKQQKSFDQSAFDV